MATVLCWESRYEAHGELPPRGPHCTSRTAVLLGSRDHGWSAEDESFEGPKLHVNLIVQAFYM